MKSAALLLTALIASVALAGNASARDRRPEPLRIIVDEPGPHYGWWPLESGPSRRFVARSLAFAECRDRLRYLAEPLPRMENPQVYRFQREDHCARTMR